MSDEELVQAVREALGISILVTSPEDELARLWNPLAKTPRGLWDCQQVVDTMMNNGLWFEWIGDTVEFILPREGLEHPDRSVSCTSRRMQQRAILEAALAAVRAAKGTTT